VRSEFRFLDSSTDRSEGRAVSGNKEKAGCAVFSGQCEKEKQIGKRIAIVDDEEDLCSAISMILKHLGYDIECIAHGGGEIVQAVIRGKHPGVIIMDYRTPGMDGLQAAEIVLKEMPNIKIIIASVDGVDQASNYLSRAIVPAEAFLRFITWRA